MIVRQMNLDYVFEFFELYPTNESVIGTQRRLCRCPPEPTHTDNASIITDPRVLEPLIEALVKLDESTPSKARPVVQKAGSSTDGIRGTVNTKFLDEMLVGIPRAIG